MAIKREKKETGQSIPAKLADMLLKGFTFQGLKDRYEDAFKGVKGDVISYLDKNDDGFDVDLGKGFKCDQGTVIYQSRSNWSFDKDKIIALVKSGKVTIETILSIAKFGAEDLEKAIGTEFKSLATKSKSESLTFRGTPDFKKSIEDAFNEKMSGEIEKPEPKPEKKERIPLTPTSAKYDPDVKSSLAKIKAAAKKNKNAEDDLDEILKK